MTEPSFINIQNNSSAEDMTNTSIEAKDLVGNHKTFNLRGSIETNESILNQTRYNTSNFLPSRNQHCKTAKSVSRVTKTV